jgi:hypothetical protein
LQAFYGWAAKFTPHFPHVHITTRHSYQIQYAFRWQCTNAACAFLPFLQLLFFPATMAMLHASCDSL